MLTVGPKPPTPAWDSSEYHRETHSSVRDRIQFVEHKGKHILVSDFSGVDPATGKAICAAVHHLVQQQAPASVRSLVVLENVFFDHELLAIGREVIKRDKPFIKKTAVIGVSGMLYIVFQSVAQFSQREMMFFHTRAEALDWLAQDSHEGLLFG